MRVAETRAVNRALRKAYGIGLCSVEEFGSKDPDAPHGERNDPIATHSSPATFAARAAIGIAIA